MKIQSVITTEIDLNKVYEFCAPINRKKCIEAIRENVDFYIRMRATDENGWWTYPDEESLANDLIVNNLAIAVNR